MKRIVIFGLLAAILWTAENIWLSARQPEISKALALQQVNGGDQARFEAQKKENDRLELEAQGFAEKARREAQGQADSRKTAAAGEAEAIRVINNAALEAQQNPLLMQLKALEVEKTRIEKWDGRYPQMWLGANASGGPSANMLFQLPTLTPEARTSAAK